VLRRLGATVARRSLTWGFERRLRDSNPRGASCPNGISKASQVVQNVERKYRFGSSDGLYAGFPNTFRTRLTVPDGQ
jgi:hypothetical protein